MNTAWKIFFAFVIVILLADLSPGEESKIKNVCITVIVLSLLVAIILPPI